MAAPPVPKVNIPIFPQTTGVPTVTAPALPQAMQLPIVPRPMALTIAPTVMAPKTPTVPVPTTLLPTVPRVPITNAMVPGVIVPTIPRTPTVPVPGITMNTVPRIPATDVAIKNRLRIVPFTGPFAPTVPPTPTVPVPGVVMPTVPRTPTIAMPVFPRTPTVPGPGVVMPMFPRTPTVPVPQVTVPRTPTMVPVPQVTVPRTPTMVPVPQVTVPRTPGTPKAIPVIIAPLGEGTTIMNAAFTPEMIDDDTAVDLANALDGPRFRALLQFLDFYYNNEEALVSDEVYEELLTIYRNKYGPYNEVGAEPTGEKADLPYYLGSLRKVKEEKEVVNWTTGYPGPYLIEDKIDGLTLLIYSRMVNGRRVTSAYTRGKGYRGKDVSHLLGYMGLPQLTTDIAIRGEIVMAKATFAKIKTNYPNPRTGKEFKNARNLVSGVVNAEKQFNPVLARELSFYAYRIMDRDQTPEQDIQQLMMMGFQVPSPVAAQTINKDILTNYFERRKKEAPYEMDGLVVYQNRVGTYPEGEDPRHVIAFKTGSETAVTTVTKVDWHARRGKRLAPVVHYETTPLSGADLSKASGYNARFIVNNNIGPGARILLTRSGDVIPKILTVLTPAPGGPALPDINVFGAYNWDANGVQFIAEKENNETIGSRLKHFLDTIGVKNFGRKRVELMVDAGIRSINELLRVTPQQLAGIPGLGTTLTNQLYNDIRERITNVSLARIMDASGIFPNIGERSFEAILEVHPNLLEFAKLDANEVAGYIRGVKGFNAKADVIAEHLPEFAQWLSEQPMIVIETPQPVAPVATAILQVPTLQLTLAPFPGTAPAITMPTTLTMQPIAQPRVVQQAATPAGGANLAGMTFVFSGFRNKDMEDAIRRRGGKTTTAVSRNTTMVIMKDLDPKSMKGKAQEAQDKGIPLMTRDEFELRYLA